ncbi:hypothetical protein EPN52_04225 [bacterium]|nr:MAG: hypothetical protein EPN52_04225 [bacterium]
MTSRERDDALQPRILAHYQMVGPLLERSFAGAPIVYASFPAGFEQPARYRVLGIPLSERKLLWACHRYDAVEFYTWAPLPQDEDRLRFARILVEGSALPKAHAAIVTQAMTGRTWCRRRSLASMRERRRSFIALRPPPSAQTPPPSNSPSATRSCSWASRPRIWAVTRPPTATPTRCWDRWAIV